MAGAGGGAWKVAYADFVTAMMAFFLVMWITGQNNSVKQAVAQYFEDPSASAQRSGGSPLLPPNKAGQPPGSSLLPSAKVGDSGGGGSANTAGHRSLNEGLQENDGRKSGLFVIHNADRRLVGAMILFTESAVELDAIAKDRLMQVAEELRGKPQKIEIRGHAASSRPSPESGGQDAWQMSYARCQATLEFLVRQGIEPERIRLSQGGAYEPCSLEADPSQQAYNSRVEVYVLGEYAENLMGTPDQRAQRFSAP